MSELDDHELLAEFAGNESEPAFAELVARHVNLVYSAALRFSSNPHHAEEITQAVFIILASKAGKLSSRIVLSGWLYQTARLTAANFVKGEIRRQNREQEAYMQSTLNETDLPCPSEEEAWQDIAPLLDEAMGGLGETDRNAVVLRFFENKTAAEVAAALRLTEAAAHKRVNRALEKLRKIFTKRGVTFSAVAIAGAVTANAVQAAPAELTTTIVATAVKGSAVATSTITLVKGTLKVMTYAKLKLALGITVATLLAAGTLTVALSSGTDANSDSIGEASAQEKAFAEGLMQATKDEDYKAFVANGDKSFHTIKEKEFKAACVQTTAELKKGYHVIFLGGFKMKGSHVTLWKITYDDHGDDDLLHLSVKNGKINGALYTDPFE